MAESSSNRRRTSSLSPIEATHPQSGRTASERSKGWKRRTAKACDACRKRKIKCDGVRPKCSRCNLNGFTCIYADFEKEEPARRGRGSNYVKLLEQRLRHVEKQLNRPESLPSAEEEGNDYEPSPSQTDQGELSMSEDDTSQNSLFVRGRAGEQRFFGPSSTMSILSPNWLRWIASRTSDPSIHQALNTPLTEGCRWTGYTHPLIQEVLEQQSKGPLPPWNEALSLVELYFQTHHKTVPIFHMETFMGLLTQQYSQDPVSSPGWWASLNAVLALAQRRRDEDTNAPDKDRSWQFARNAFDAVLDILMRNTSMMSVQALTVLSQYFLGTPNPQPSFFLASAAVRIAHAIGLQQTVSRTNFSAFEREQRHSLFWCVAILDQSTSFRTGRPAAQPLYEIKVELPRCRPRDLTEILFVDGTSEKVDIFHFSAWLARIQAEIYHRLLPPSRTRISETQMTTIVQELSEWLEQWALALPANIRPGCSVEAWAVPTCLSLGRLHLDYHDCVISIHRMNRYNRTGMLKTEEGSGGGIDPSDPSASSSSFAKCIRAARCTVQVLKLIPDAVESFCWIAIQHPVSAVMVLLSHVLQAPTSSTVVADMKAAEDAMHHFSRISSGRIESLARPTHAVMKELYKVATAIVARANKSAYEEGYSGTKHDHIAPPPPSLPPIELSPPSVLPVVVPTSTQQWGDASVGSDSSGHGAATITAFQTTAQTHGNPTQGQGGLSRPVGINYGAGVNNLFFEPQPQDAWEALSQMPLPFPWNWQDVPLDVLQEFDAL